MKLRGRLVIVVCLVLGGCPPPHGPAVPALPSKGGPAWIEVTSPHFIVWTDSSEARGRVLAQQMEDYRRIVVGMLFVAGEPKAPPTLVLALRDAEEVGAYVPKEFVAYAWSGGALRQPVIIVAADTHDDNNHIFIHELTHAITFGVIQHQPKWFVEGLANFFETMKPRPGDDLLEVGRPLDFIVARLRAQHMMPTAALWGCNQNACMDDLYYATAWATFSFLASTRTPALLRYMQRLAAINVSGTASPEQLAAWTEVFPDLPPDQLDHAVASWFVAGRGIVIRYPFRSEKVATTARLLGDADVLAARGIMRWIFARPAPRPAQSSTPRWLWTRRNCSLA